MTAIELGVHLADGLNAYAAQLAGEPQDHWVPIQAHVEEPVTSARVIEAVAVGGRMLEIVSQGVSPSTRAHHSWGISDPDGFLAMGCVEMMVHVYDIATAFGERFEAPDHIATAALARLFRDIPTDAAPGAALLWCTGRIELPVHEKLDSWRWYAEVTA